MRPFKNIAAVAAASTLCIFIASCQSRPPASGPDRSALSTMERVAVGANSCWFKSGDTAFSAYRLAPELNSFTGRPRILVVHKNSPEGRPLLVVQAEGNPARLQAFGPMMSEPVSTRIAGDVTRWSGGGKTCR
jgi:hypothetical protein